MFIKSGTVKFTAQKIMQTRYGEKKNMVIILDDGQEEKIWFNPGQQPHENLNQKGARVNISYEQNQRGGLTKKLITGTPTISDQNFGGQNAQTQTYNQAPAYQAPPVHNYPVTPPPAPQISKAERAVELASEKVDLLECIIDKVDALFKKHEVVEVIQETDIEDVPFDAKEIVQGDPKSFYNLASPEDKRALIVSLMISIDKQLG